MARVRQKGSLKASLLELTTKLKKAKVVRSGFLAGAKYPDGTSVAMNAALQNFGAPAKNIPPRPFFSNMIAAKKDGWGASLAAKLKKADNDARAALELMGHEIDGDIRQSIIDTNEPPLKEATIRRKGFSKPLIHTSHMINSVDHEVE